MTIPRVGLTTYREPAAWGVWNERADLLPANYADSVARAGGVAMLLPPADPSVAGSALDGLDGLLLAGGTDVDPARYGAGRDPATGAARPDRDEWELALAHGALERDLPVFAVCRGVQVLNVALGGDLHQHLPDTVGSDRHLPTVGAHGHHDVELTAGSVVHAACGAALSVATYHHQAIRRVADGLVVTGRAADGVVEAVELPGRTWVVGVQWHPEVASGAPLFDAFVAACATRAVSAQ